jgi:outer membrane protein assembly factor BamA
MDGRVFQSLGEPGKFVLAARMQAGAVFGSDLLETPRDDLFFSGGGGTVRGQPYRSLGLAITRGFGPQFLIGGRYFLAGSVEMRAKVSDKIGVVGFVDWGSIGLDSFTTIRAWGRSGSTWRHRSAGQQATASRSTLAWGNRSDAAGSSHCGVSGRSRLWPGGRPRLPDRVS